jgi:hypothetical protein
MVAGRRSPVAGRRSPVAGRRTSVVSVTSLTPLTELFHFLPRSWLTFYLRLGSPARFLGSPARLFDVPLDGERRGRPVWRIATALRVLNRRDGGSGSEAAAAEIEETCERLQAGLDRARGIDDLEKRRALLKEVDPLCGRLDRLMEAQDNGDIARELLHREAMRDAIAQFVTLWSGKSTAPPAA